MAINPYAKFVGGREPLAVMAGTAAELRALVSGLSKEQLERPIAEGKWSVRQIVCHLADCEIVFCVRLRHALADDHHVIQPFDQDVWASRYAGYSAAEALDLFAAARAWNLRLLKGVAAEEMQRPVTHPERGTMVFADLVQTIAGHDENHLIQLRGAVK